MEIVKIIDISFFFTSVFNKTRMKVCNERKKPKKMTLIDFSDVQSLLKQLKQCILFCQYKVMFFIPDQSVISLSFLEFVRAVCFRNFPFPILQATNIPGDDLEPVTTNDLTRERKETAGKSLYEKLRQFSNIFITVIGMLGYLYN